MHRADRPADQQADRPAERVADDPAALRDLAIELARRAGTIAVAGRRAISGGEAFDRRTKSSTTDIVTEFDRAAEVAIVDGLHRHRPGDAIVGEEGTAEHGTTGYSWFLDPIDGTTNFVYDHPLWSCSIGVSHADTMVAGAVYVPVLDEMFDAVLGGGARLNGRAIGTGTETEPALALIGTGFGYHAEIRRHQAARIANLIGEVRDIRRGGSAAIDLSFVACGRLDAYYEEHLNPWDCAAGTLIAREAGAITTDFAGGPARPEQLLASSPGLHAALVALLARSDPG